jgi:hypothetical protein
MTWGCTASDGSGFVPCGRVFGSLRSFDRHFIKAGKADNPSRNRRSIAVDGMRCATEIELDAMGLVQNARGVWRDLSRGAFNPYGGGQEAGRASAGGNGP